MNGRGEEVQQHSQIEGSPELTFRPQTPTSNIAHRPRLKLPQISQFSIACYAGFVALAALYVTHSSANTSADTAILANKIATASLSQAQVANQIQLLQLCLLNSTLLSGPCDAVLAPATALVPNIAALTAFQYGSAAANDAIEARFVRELMGFHVLFFSLLAFAVIHVLVSLWLPVKDYLRQRRAGRYCPDAKSRSGEFNDGFVDGRRATIIHATSQDQDEEFQTGHTEMGRVQGDRPLSFARGNSSSMRLEERHFSMPDLVESSAVRMH